MKSEIFRTGEQEQLKIRLQQAKPTASVYVNDKEFLSLEGLEFPSILLTIKNGFEFIFTESELSRFMENMDNNHYLRSRFQNAENNRFGW